MPFPDAQRVIYNKNPLDRVICQLRFPPILKIDSELPADFQDKIRADFPNFSESSEIKIEVPQGKKFEIPLEFVKQAVQSSGIKNYEFSSEDGIWKVNLTRTFISLSTIKYEKWELFKDKLNGPLKALIDIYSPLYFYRIGLRYIDVIRRSLLGLDNVRWEELIKPYILGLMSSEVVGDNIKNMEAKYIILLADNESKVRILIKMVESDDKKENCFMIDSDFYKTNRASLAEAMDKLDFFNKRASRLIQWCITDQLHNAMEPDNNVTILSRDRL